MFLFYICPRATVFQNAHKLGEFHMVHVDEAAGTVLLKANMRDDVIEEWFSNLEGVEPLPHPLAEHSKPLHPLHAGALKHLGVKQGHTIHEALDVISQHHTGKAFRTRVF